MTVELRTQDVVEDNFTHWSFIEGKGIINDLEPERESYEKASSEFIEALDLPVDRESLGAEIAQSCFIKVDGRYARPNPKVIANILKGSDYSLTTLQQIMSVAYEVRNFGSPATFWEQEITSHAEQPWHPDDVVTASVGVAMHFVNNQPRSQMIFKPHD